MILYILYTIDFKLYTTYYTLDTRYDIPCSSMAYNTEAGPTKYLVGTEQGTVLSINLRNKKDGGIVVYDEGPGKHHGPIYSIERNPLHTKFFLTVGDWTARVWDCGGGLCPQRSIRRLQSGASPAYATPAWVRWPGLWGNLA